MYPLGSSSLRYIVIAAFMLAGCATLPRVELKSYTAAFTETQSITDGVLDIVAPYERVVLRYAARRRTVRVPATTPPAPELPPGVDPSLLAQPPRTPAPATRTRTVVFERRCRGGVGGSHPFCYELRDAYANIGDPPLVHAYRNLSDVIARFNVLLVAYADGVSGKLLAQELNGLSTAVAALGSAVPATGGAAAQFGGLVSRLLPIATIAGAAIDRAQLRAFLLDNYPLIDEALTLMATKSPALYSNVVTGTNLFLIKARGVTATLRQRQLEIRRLIANWTVVLDENRRLLRELKFAIENPDALETRLRNLNDSAVTARIDTSAIKKQIATLGTPVLPP